MLMVLEANCILCRGTKMLCGRAYCPVLVVTRTVEKFSFRGTVLEASTPPTVYVGWRNYPRVTVGPAAPPLIGDTRIYDEPEKWLERSVNEVLELRLSLVRGLSLSHVKRGGTIVERLREVILSSTPVDVEVRFLKPPRGRLVLDPHSPPSGPSGLMENLRVLGNPKVDRVVEKVYGDVDLRAEEAVLHLYSSGIPVSRIQRLFSLGVLGVGRYRKLVPTRWSITAVDDMLSRNIIRSIRRYPPINDVLLFYRRYAKNLFIAILVPGPWSFEWMEAWFPNTVWNRSSRVSIEGDWEFLKPRREYASIGGCYYATRLAVCEYLNRIRRQATVIVLREIYEGFDIPLGVWFVRENVRRLFDSRPIKLESLEEALAYLGKHTRVPPQIWIRKSRLIRSLLGRETLERFLR